MHVVLKSSPALPGLLAQRCASFAGLSDDEHAFLRALELKPRRSHRIRARLWSAGTAGAAPLYLVSGWAVHARELADGRRLLFDVFLPGDIIGLEMQSLEGGHVFALTAGRTVDAGDLRGLLSVRDRHPGICRSLDLAAAERSAFRIDHMVRLGRQTAMERLVHLLLELDHRLRQRGLSNEGCLPLPLTQEVLGDLLGLSLVHINRTLQQLRRENLITLERGQLSLLRIEELARMAEFRPPACGKAGLGLNRNAGIHATPPTAYH